MDTTPGPVVNTDESRRLLPDDDDDIGEFKPSLSYATKKTVAKGCLDLALLTANVSQLKALVQAGAQNHMYNPLIVMIIISIILQVGTGVLLVVLGAADPRSRRGHRRVELMNNASVILIVVITFLNIFIATLGINGK